MKLNRKWIMVLALVMSMAMATTGTLAYLTDRDSEANVFTMGNVEIDLTEDFDQGAELLPGLDIEKKPVITNTGKTEAWAWLTFSIPAALDNAVQGTEQGSNENVIHWNPLGATTEGYVTDARVQKAFADGLLTADMFPAGTTNYVDYINANNMTWNVFNSLGEGQNMYEEEINGVKYNTYVLLYNKALQPGETTLPNIYKVFLDAYVDIDPDGNLSKVNAGVVTPIDWNINEDKDGNPIIYASAYAIQKEGFATVEEAYAAYNAQWGENGKEYGEDDGETDSATAVFVNNAQELKDAMLIRGAKIYLGKDIVVDADTPLQWGKYMFVANGREVTINLNGKTITVTEDASLKTNGLFTTANGGTLNIVGEGTVEVKNGKSGIFHAMNANDQINVYGGTYISNSDNGSDALAIIYTNSGNVDVYGGKFCPLDGIECTNAEDNQGNRLSIVFHEGALLKHDKYYAGADATRVQLEQGCKLEETVINGTTWYKVVKE